MVVVIQLNERQTDYLDEILALDDLGGFLEEWERQTIFDILEDGTYVEGKESKFLNGLKEHYYKMKK